MANCPAYSDSLSFTPTYITQTVSVYAYGANDIHTIEDATPTPITVNAYANSVLIYPASCVTIKWFIEDD